MAAMKEFILQNMTKTSSSASLMPKHRLATLDSAILGPIMKLGRGVAMLSNIRLLVSATE
jgi:hypothetical protein